MSGPHFSPLGETRKGVIKVINFKVPSILQVGNFVASKVTKKIIESQTGSLSVPY
jgi:hypothetical protein